MVARQNDPARVELHRMIREREAALVSMYLTRGGRLLEVGAGNGHQAKFFASIGFQVDAIDVESSPRVANAVFPVKIYDGRHIPFPNETFDVVFSSNVLEHVLHCDELLNEMGRVLKANGVMIHIIPTPSWRIWTSVAHYIRAFQMVTSFASPSPGGTPVPKTRAGEDRPARKSLPRVLRAGLFPFRHGVRGNWLTEVSFFSRGYWERTFRRARLRICTVKDTGIFYTGYGIPGSTCGLDQRAKLARWLGSCTAMYVLKKIEC